MQEWKRQTPIMSSAKLLMNYREELWKEIVAHPEWDSIRVDKEMKKIAQLNKFIARRTFNPTKVKDLMKKLKAYSRNNKRVAKTLKISKRAVKFIVKQTKSKNGTAGRKTKKG